MSLSRPIGLFLFLLPLLLLPGCAGSTAQNAAALDGGPAMLYSAATQPPSGGVRPAGERGAALHHPEQPCLQDVNHNGRLDVVDILAALRQPPCRR
ncbi:MAG: hypothetical protein D6775_07460, partial [Caldilineae bacterium]